MNLLRVALLATAMIVTACTPPATAPVSVGGGPNPELSPGPPVDVLTGFVNAEGKAHGRPVGVAIDRQGALLVADDVGNVIWRVTSDTVK